MESWRLGGLESLRAGDLESGKAGELESMRPGELETLSKDSLARIPQPGIFKKICLGSPLESDIFFLICWTPNFWISRSPDLQFPTCPRPQISKFPDFQVPRFPDAAGRTLRSRPDPSPNAPKDQIRRKGPCCDSRFFSGIL